MSRNLRSWDPDLDGTFFLPSVIPCRYGILTGDGSEGGIRLWSFDGRTSQLANLHSVDQAHGIVTGTGSILGAWTLSVLPNPIGPPLIASGGGDHCIRLWDFSNSPDSPVAVLEGHSSWVRALSTFLPPTLSDSGFADSPAHPFLVSGCKNETLVWSSLDLERLIRRGSGVDSPNRGFSDPISPSLLLEDGIEEVENESDILEPFVKLEFGSRLLCHLKGLPFVAQGGFHGDFRIIDVSHPGCPTVGEWTWNGNANGHGSGSRHRHRHGYDHSGEVTSLSFNAHRNLLASTIDTGSGESSSDSSVVRMWDISNSGERNSGMPVLTLRVESGGGATSACFADSEQRDLILVGSRFGKLRCFDVRKISSAVTSADASTDRGCQSPVWEVTLFPGRKVSSVVLLDSKNFAAICGHGLFVGLVDEPVMDSPPESPRASRTHASPRTPHRHRRSSFSLRRTPIPDLTPALSLSMRPQHGRSSSVIPRLDLSEILPQPEPKGEIDIPSPRASPRGRQIEASRSRSRRRKVVPVPVLASPRNPHRIVSIDCGRAFCICAPILLPPTTDQISDMLDPPSRVGSVEFHEAESYVESPEGDGEFDVVPLTRSLLLPRNCIPILAERWFSGEVEFSTLCPVDDSIRDRFGPETMGQLQSNDAVILWTETYSGNVVAYAGNWASGEGRSHHFDAKAHALNPRGPSSFSVRCDPSKTQFGRVFAGALYTHITVRGFLRTRQGAGVEKRNDQQNSPKFRGFWREDSRHGVGSEFDPEGGVVVQGSWKNGTLCRRLDFHSIPQLQDLGAITNYTLLGSGAWGHVYRVSFRGQTCALKVFDCRNEDVFRTKYAFIKSIMEVLAPLDHPNILKIHHWFAADHPAYKIGYVMEYSKQSVATLFDSKNLPILREKKLDIALATANGMRYLHSVGIVHGNLKWDNVLYDPKVTCKVSDIDVAREDASLWRKTSRMRVCLATPCWASPEVIEYSMFDFRSDVFSFGICLFCLAMENAAPYALVDRCPDCRETLLETNFTKHLLEHSMRPPVPDDVAHPLDRLLLDLAERCWCRDPRRRPNFDLIVRVLLGARILMDSDEYVDLSDCPACVIGLRLRDSPPDSAVARTVIEDRTIASLHRAVHSHFYSETFEIVGLFAEQVQASGNCLIPLKTDEDVRILEGGMTVVVEPMQAFVPREVLERTAREDKDTLAEWFDKKMTAEVLARKKLEEERDAHEGFLCAELTGLRELAMAMLQRIAYLEEHLVTRRRDRDN